MQADEYEQKGDLGSAIRVLSQTLSSSQVQRVSFKKKLEDRLESLRNQKKETDAKARSRYESAKSHLEKHEYNLAMKLLEAIDPVSRTEEVEALMEQIRSTVARSKQMRRELAEKIRMQDLPGALTVAFSLRAIHPKDPKIAKLAEDIAHKLIARAEQLAKSGRNPDAWKLIRRINTASKQSASNDPEGKQLPAQLADRFGQLRDSVRLNLWTSRFVTKAQSVDAGLVGCLRYLAALPGHGKYKQPLEEAQKRLQQRPKSGQGIPWAAGQQTTPFDIPVTGFQSSLSLDGLERLTAGGNTIDQFLIAIGLAFQGLGTAAVPTTLFQSKKSFLGLELGRRTKGRVAWGINFGASSLKAVRLSCEKGPVPEIVGQFKMSYSDDGKIATPDDVRSSMIRALQTLKSEFGIRKDEIITVNLDSNQILTRFFSIPASDNKTTETVLEFEAEHQIPFPIADVVWDKHLASVSDAGQVPVVLVAARRSDVERCEKMFDAVGLKITAVQSEPIALFNCWSHCSSNDSEVQAFLDIGASSSTLSVLAPGRIWYRTFGIGTGYFVRQVSRDLRLRTEQAHHLLHNPLANETPFAPALFSMATVYKELVAEIERSLRAFEVDFSGLRPEKIVCIGGGTHLPGFLTFLRVPGKELSVD